MRLTGWNKEAIENAFGHALKWNLCRVKNRAEFILKPSPAISLDEAKSGLEMIDWLVNLTAFEKAFPYCH